MKKNLLFWGALGLLSLGNLSAQEILLQPTPQEIRQTSDFVAVPDFSVYNVKAELLETPAGSLLKQILPMWEKGAQGSNATKVTFTVNLGVKGDKAVRKVKRHIPTQAEGYYLQITPEGITVAGSDERGLYYGVQSLAQLVSQGRLPVTEVTDYPDVRWRGVVEGFYGTPWSHEARLRQLDFYGRNKLNVYLYGPKDDPYHSVPNWRKPYPPKEAAQLQELVRRAQANEVLFYWAIHPGQDIKWNTEDRDLLMQKFESMYQLGVRAFAVFFDDISGEGAKAPKQAELLNYIDDNFVKVKGDVAPLVMCPTEYNKSWSNVKGGYLTTLGSVLNKSIEIMWTGDRVIACIDKKAMDFINPLLQRKAYIWWNFPVSDYVRDHLLMGPVYGNGLDIKDDMSAFVSNPMERPEASKLALYSVADYAWNLDSFDSEASWKRAIKDLMPNHAAELEVFAKHNSDLGVNGHGFRREESVELTPVLKALADSYGVSGAEGAIDRKAYRDVLVECNEIIRSADMLLTSKESRELIGEIRPWIMQFKLVGEYGKVVLDLVRAQLADVKKVAAGGESAVNNEKCDGRGACDAKNRFEVLHAHAQALQTQMYEVDATYNQNPYQPGVKSGSRILLPTFHKLFEVATVRYNRTHDVKLDSRAVYMPYTLWSDVKQLSLLPMRQKGKTGSVSPSNEVIIWQADGLVSVKMDYVRVLRDLVVDLGVQGAEKNFKLEVTSDGLNWEELNLIPTGYKTQLKVNVSGKKVSEVRLVNVSGGEQKVYFRQFAFAE